MKDTDITKIIKNSLDNFFVEFVIMNQLHNNKLDNNVFSFGAYMPDFKHIFLLNKINEETLEHIEEMLFEVQAEMGYHYNLSISYEVTTDLSKYRALLKNKNFRCIFIRPDFRELQKDCKPVFMDRIKYFFNKYY